MNLSKLFFRFGIIFMIASIAAEPINSTLLELGSILALVGAILPVVGIGIDLYLDHAEDDRDDRRYTNYVTPIPEPGVYVDRPGADPRSAHQELENRLDDYEIDRDEIRGGDS